MKVIVQKVKHANCVVDNKIVSEIKHGFLLLVSFTYGDSLIEVQKMAKKIAMCTSCIFFIICMYTLSFTSLQRCFFSIVMSVYYISLILYFKKDVHTFYMYRFIHPIQKNIKMHSCNDIYKNHTNVYIKNGCIKNEKG